MRAAPVRRPTLGVGGKELDHENQKALGCQSQRDCDSCDAGSDRAGDRHRGGLRGGRQTRPAPGSKPTKAIGSARAWGPSRAYLSADEMLRVAREAGVDAIHPGYGFLSENPDFAEACAAARLIFIGPSPEVMRSLGNKVSARRLAEQAGVPVMPASGPLPEDPAEIESVAADIGYPLMLKASWGGGGRGMRMIEGPDQLFAQVEAGRREAEAAFGNGEVYLEKLVRRARHVEVQILGDRHGELVHLFERDCSMQRRNQKVVERAPAPYLDAGQREELCTAALRPRPPCRLCQRRDGRVSDGCRQRRLLFHRGQSAYPGRAHGDGRGHRHRPGQSADPDCPGCAHRRPGLFRRSWPERHSLERARSAVPRHQRGSGEQLCAGLWPHHGLSRCDRLRHPARRRHGLFRRRSSPAITIRCWKRSPPGRPSRKRRCAAWTGRCANSAFAGGDQPGVPGEPDQPSQVRRRRLHDALHRRDAGAVRLSEAARPGDPAAAFHCRCHRQRQSGGGRAARRPRAVRGPVLPGGLPDVAPEGSKQLLDRLGPEAFSAGCWSRSGC